MIFLHWQILKKKERFIEKLFILFREEKEKTKHTLEAQGLRKGARKVWSYF